MAKGYTYGFKWEIWTNVSNPSERSWVLVYNDDGIDDPMGEVVKSDARYVATVYPKQSKIFTTLSDAKMYVEDGFGIRITKKKTAKKKITKKGY